MSIKYDFNDIWRLADALRQNGHALQQESETLQTAVQSLRGTFTGSGAAAYDQAIAKWNSELSDTQTILEDIAKKVEQAATDMKVQDDTVAKNINV